jgi:ketosteroid isomerase-like protein
MLDHAAIRVRDAQGAILRGRCRGRNVDKTKDFIAAYNRRDFDGAVAWFHPEIGWVLPPGQSSDSCRGPEEVRRFWNGLHETFEELRLDPQEFVDVGDRVATRLRYYGRGKRSGVEIEEELYHQVTTFEAGWIVRIRYFTDWSEALDAVRSE